MHDININKRLIDFIDASPSAYHAVENVRRELEAAGYTEFFEGDDWSALAVPGKYYVRRNGSSIIALRLPKRDFRGYMIMAAHSDSPSFKIKWNAEVKAAGMYSLLNVEKYGGMLCSTWLDRPLSVAGRAIVAEDGRMTARLVDIDRELALIPNVAIHMDRSANEGKSYNANVDMLPLIGGAELKKGFKSLIAESLNVAEDALLAGDLMLYPRARGCIWGAEEEYLSSARLDDLQCVYGCLEGLLAAEDSESAAVLSVFDNEEVGSGTKQGADSSFLEDVLYRAAAALGRSEAQYRALLSNSFMVSADNAHAVHPNHPEYADRNDRPEMNKGIVIKHNANQRYTTDAVSAAAFESVCRRAGVPVQSFTNRGDIAGGSTLGHISTAHVSVNSVDIGLAQLAMHSAYETAGARDTEYLAAAAREFFGSSFTQRGEVTEI